MDIILLFRDRVMTADFISRMVTISITAEAFAAIEATLPKGAKGAPRPDGNVNSNVGAVRIEPTRLAFVPRQGGPAFVSQTSIARLDSRLTP
jgi:hypothetical protein